MPSSKRLAGFLCAAALLHGAGAPEGAAPAAELLERKLLARVRAIDAALSGALGFAAVDLTNGRAVSWNGDTVFPQASSIKIPIMVQVFQSARDGRLDLAESVTLQPADAVAGSGHLQILLRSGPVTLTVAELTSAMIETSDNTATNKLIFMVGMDAVNASMRRLGLKETRLRRIMLDGAAAARDEENVSTPLEMAALAAAIYRGEAVSPEASRSMIENMQRVDADFRAAVPRAVAVASKPGELAGVRCETGLVLLPGRPFALSVMSTFLDEGENPVREAARAAYEYFEKLGASNRFGNRVR